MAAVGALALAGTTAFPARLSAQAVTFTVTIEDASGAAIAAAVVKNAAGQVLGSTDSDGRLTLSCISLCNLRVQAPGFQGRSVQLNSAATLRLEPAATEQVTVTAYRSPLGMLESPATTRLLTQANLTSTAAVTLDGQLRQLPGVELFRRSSSLVANPTSQGISLRGLGSTSASRTLVTQDDVPLNDPLGGWIHWQEQPEQAVASVELVRGGASDLYGSSAMGGVVNVVSARPATAGSELKSSDGMEGTFDDSLLAEAKRGPWGVLAAGGLLGTGGFIQEAPSQRGPVDVNSDVHSQNGMLLAEHDRGPLRVLVRGSGFNEDRGNGTPYQINGTRLYRYATGGDWQGPRAGTLGVRLYGADESFHQTFSSISNLPSTANPGCSYRCGEVPTRYSVVPDNELGAAAHWNQPLGAGLLVVAGADVHDVRIWDREQTYGSTAALMNLHDHQRDSAAYVEALWLRKAWTVTASGRLDWFQNFDGQLLIGNGAGWSEGPVQPVEFGQHVFDPARRVAQDLESLGGFSVGVSSLPCANAQRTLSLDTSGQQAHPGQRNAAERARNRLGDRRGHRMAVGRDSDKLLFDPGKPAYCGSHHLPGVFADPAEAG